MFVIGITGGTGAGKTTALDAVRALGGEVLDCDAVYHRLLLEDRRILEESTPEQFFTSPKTEQAEKFLQSFEFNRKKKAEA